MNTLKKEIDIDSKKYILEVNLTENIDYKQSLLNEIRDEFIKLKSNPFESLRNMPDYGDVSIIDMLYRNKLSIGQILFLCYNDLQNNGIFDKIITENDSRFYNKYSNDDELLKDCETL